MLQTDYNLASPATYTMLATKEIFFQKPTVRKLFFSNFLFAKNGLELELYTVFGKPHTTHYAMTNIHFSVTHLMFSI